MLGPRLTHFACLRLGWARFSTVEDAESAISRLNGLQLTEYQSLGQVQKELIVSHCNRVNHMFFVFLGISWEILDLLGFSLPKLDFRAICGDSNYWGMLGIVGFPWMF